MRGFAGERGVRRVSCWFWLMVVILLAACGQDAKILTSTPTLTPVPTATITPIPSPTFTPTPQLSDVNIAVTVDAPDQQLPGDGHSTTRVTVTVSAPPSLEMQGLTVFFRVEGGGSVNPISVPLADGQAMTVYTAGETGSESQVLLSAIIDVPRLGRAQDTAELTLVRQTVTLGFDGPLVIATGMAQDVALNLQTYPATLGGRYPVVVGASAGLLQTADDQAEAVRLEMQPGSTLVRYIAPTTPVRGQGTLCVRLADRMDMGENCVPVYWGPPAAHLDVQISDRVFWSLDERAYIGVAARDERGHGIKTIAVICYHVGAVPYAAPDNNYFPQYPTAPRSVIADGECVATETVWDPTAPYIYTGFSPWRETWVVGWEILAPGQDGRALQYTDTTIFTARTVRIIDPTAVLQLPNGATLTFPENEIPVNFRLHTTQTWDANRPTTTGLVRFYVPDTAFEAEKGTIMAITAWDTYVQTNKPDMFLTFTTDRLDIDYRSDLMLTNPATDSTWTWREVFAFVEINTSALNWQ